MFYSVVVKSLLVSLFIPKLPSGEFYRMSTKITEANTVTLASYRNEISDCLHPGSSSCFSVSQKKKKSGILVAIITTLALVFYRG